MKFRILFKSPDALFHAIPDAGDVCYEIESEPSEYQELEMKKVFDKFVKYGENVVIEFDTIEVTATVVPRK